MKTVRDFNVGGKRVLVRCDFNVPLSKEGDILDDFRIRKTLPTIKYLIEARAKVILMSHLGDPKGRFVNNLKLNKIQEKLAELLGFSVFKAQGCTGKDIEEVTLKLKEGEILLLENLRFQKEEEEGNMEFAQNLARLGDIYINDAFGVCHRPHASIIGVPKFLPSGMGLRLEEEIEILSELRDNPKKPLTAIIGGKKVETKGKLIEKISQNADWVLIGGLLKKEVDDKKMDFKNSQKILGPIDIIDADLKVKNFQDAGLDIGPGTRELFKGKILMAKSIFWNGPMGLIEDEKFAEGTQDIAKSILESKAFSVIGGGETIEFANKLGITEKFSYASTGGGAMISFLSGEELPGIEALKS